ncbi:MAG: beta/gamma crystallin-related protein [Pseudomonadota bacterium]
MNKTLCIAAVALATLAGGAAQAQRYGGNAITLYDQPNFQGASVTITQSAPDLGKWRFNDRAQSAKVQGRWLACEHDEFKGRCQELRGDIPNLHEYRLMAQISSLEPAGQPRPGPGPVPPRPGGGAGSRGVEGARTVFFAQPRIDGYDVAAGDRGADSFCRRQGLGPAVWYDSSERAREAIGPDGQIVGRSSVLRDLLCRRY